MSKISYEQYRVTVETVIANILKKGDASSAYGFLVGIGAELLRILAKRLDGDSVYETSQMMMWFSGLCSGLLEFSAQKMQEELASGDPKVIKQWEDELRRMKENLGL